MTPKISVLLITILATCATSLFALSPDPLLKEIDRLANITVDLTAEYVVVQKKPGQDLVRKLSSVYRRDQADKFVIVIQEPKIDQGKGYLRIGESLWLFDPRDKQFTYSNVRERFESSNARLSDFAGSTWARDYEIVSSKSEKLGRFDCVVYELLALRSDVTFYKSTIWVSADKLVRKSNDYSANGMLLRTVAIPSWQDTQYGWMPGKILISDKLKEGEETQISISKVSTQKLNDSLFSKDYLERLQR